MSWTGRCTVTLILIAFSIPSCPCILHTLLGVALLYDSCILQGRPEAARAVAEPRGNLLGHSFCCFSSSCWHVSGDINTDSGGLWKAVKTQLRFSALEKTQHDAWVANVSKVQILNFPPKMAAVLLLYTYEKTRYLDSGLISVLTLTLSIQSG